MTNYAIFDSKEPLSKAIAYIIDSGGSAFITENGKFAGIISDRHLTKKVGDPSRTTCGAHMVNAPSLKKDSDLESMVSSFLNGHFKTLPIVDDSGKVVGSVERHKLVSLLSDYGVFSGVPTEAVLHKPVFVINSNSTFGDAKREMKEKGVHRLVVVENGKPIGVIGKFDLTAFLLKPNRKDRFSLIESPKNLDDENIREFIRDKFKVVDFIPDLDSIATIFGDSPTSHIVVKKNGELYGVVSAFDLLKFAASQFENHLPVHLSGMETDDELAFHYQKAKGLFERAVRKYVPSLAIRRVEARFKKGKSVIEGTCHIETDGKPLLVKYEGYRANEVINGLAKEMKRVLEKAKGVK